MQRHGFNMTLSRLINAPVIASKVKAYDQS